MKTDLGPYELVAELGRGGMGVVYKAYEPALGRHVAIKVLAEPLAGDPRIRERFLREARAMAALNDPHIVQIHAIGTEAEQAYFVMEFVAGESLDAILRRMRRLSPEQALGIVAQTARGLAIAHAQGVIHRDIKPGNLILTGTGSVKIADFGIALSRDESARKLTGTGECVGTPDYMPPEVCLGRVADQRADIYSLGIVLFECLAGHLPFRHDSLLGLMRQVVEADLPDIRAIEPGADDALARILDRMTAKDPAGRYPDCGELLTALAVHSRLAAGVAVSVPVERSAASLARIERPVSSPGASARTVASMGHEGLPAPTALHAQKPLLFRRLRRYALIGFAAVTALLAATWGLKDRLSQRATPSGAEVPPHAVLPVVPPDTDVAGKTIAVLPFENLSADQANAYFAEGMQDEVLARLASLRDLKVISRTSTEQYASHPPNLKTVADQLGVTTVLEGSVQKVGGRVRVNVHLIDARLDRQLWARSYDRRLADVLSVEGDVAQNIVEALKVQLGPRERERVSAPPTTNPVAYDLYLRANERYDRGNDLAGLAGTDMVEAIALYEQALSADPRFALAAARLAEAQMQLYFFSADRTNTRLTAAKQAADRALALQPDLGEAHYALALYHYFGYRDYASALDELHLAARALPNSVEVAGTLAAIARRQGRWEDALAGYRQAAELDPRSGFPLDQMALTYASMRRYAEADRTFVRAIGVAADPATERVWRALNTVQWKGDVAPLREALHVFPPASARYRLNASNFYLLAWWSRDYAAAIEIAKADAAANWVYGNNLALPRELFLAWAEGAAGDSASARAAYAAVREQTRAVLATRPDDAELHLALAFADAGSGIADEALQESRRAVALMPVARDALTGADVLVCQARLEAALGAHEEAIAQLRRLLAMPGGTVSPALLRLDPAWDPLRRDPRFVALLAGRM